MIEINNKTRSNINLGLVKKTTEIFLRKYNKAGHGVSIAFVGDATMRRLNKIYLDKDATTDVLAFSDTDSRDRVTGLETDKSLGEIIINYAQVKRQAKRYSKSTQDELVFILVHGLLHLLGHDDSTDKGRKEMEGLERGFIEKVISNK